MKTKNLFKTLLLAIITIAATTQSYADHLSQRLMVATRLSGAQEVPAVTTAANGVASFFFNDAMDSLCVNVSVNGLSGPITGIHVHEGDAGTNGPVLTNLSNNIAGNRITATITGADLTPAIRAKYLRGQLYLNVHTAANPGGEIRGQLKLESDFAFRADIDATQNTPPTTNQATGVAAFNLSIDKRELTVNVTVDNLTGPITAAHLHYAKPGVAGGVALNLTPFINGNSIKGIVSTLLPTDLLTAVMMDSIYVNIHTTANPNGEVRGNVWLDTEIAFDAYLDTMQETTPVLVSNGYGTAWFKLSATMDTLWYNVQVSALSGAITAAHIHAGEPNQSGGVILNLTSDISTSGTQITGMKTGTDITPALIGTLLELGAYLNVHTTLNPNGEVRGQIYRVAREGYDININGSQEVPANAATAVGGGLVTVNRDRSNTHVMVVVSGLSGPITGSHFHNNVSGANGGVVYDLTSWFVGTGTDDAAFGYWHDADPTTPFAKQNELQFRRDSIYINIHTAAEPGGEIRGQAVRSADCFNVPTGINNITKGTLEAKIYPNPVVTNVNIEIASADYAADASLKIMDLTGKVVLEKNNIDQTSSIDLTTYKSGVFFMVVETKGKRMMKKLVLKN